MDRVIVCETCGAGEGREFADALRMRAPEGVSVESVTCLNQCDQPVALALRAEGKDVYLFSGIDVTRDLEDALALVRLYQAAPGGTISDARPAGRLRHCLRGRVPG